MCVGLLSLNYQSTKLDQTTRTYKNIVEKTLRYFGLIFTIVKIAFRTSFFVIPVVIIVIGHGLIFQKMALFRAFLKLLST